MANPTFDLRVATLTYQDQIDDFRTLASSLLPDWDTTNANDPVVYLAEVYLAALYQDTVFANRIANEFALQSARDRRSLFAHAKRLGYTPSTRQPAIASVTIDVQSSGTPRTIDPYEMRISTAGAADEEPIVFENTGTINVPALNDQVTGVQFAQGKTVSDSFLSSGTPFQRFRVASRPILLEETITETFTVEVNGTPWTRVTTFVDSGASDTDYILDLDFDGTGVVLFGDGVRGAVPPEGQTVAITYRIGGGISGNVKAGTLTKVVAAPSYVTGVTNPSPASNGSNEETSDHIRAYAPVAIRDAGQLNSLLAVNTYLESKASVSRSKSFVEFNQVTSVILVESGYVFSSIRPALIADVLDFLVMGFNYDILEPDFVEVDVEVNVWMRKGYKNADVVAQVNAVIDDWLDPLAVDAQGSFVNGFGQDLLLSELGYRLKTDVDGIYDYEVVTPTANVPIADTEMPTKDHTTTSVTVNVYDDLTYTSYKTPLSETS